MIAYSYFQTKVKYVFLSLLNLTYSYMQCIDHNIGQNTYLERFIVMNPSLFLFNKP
jgi:hypothetical protein